MAKLPKGALRGVKKAMKEQGSGPQKQVKADFGSKSVTVNGDRPSRLRSYNIKVHDLVEFKAPGSKVWHVGEVVGINTVSHIHTNMEENTYHILGPDGLGIQNVHGNSVRMICRIGDE